MVEAQILRKIISMMRSISHSSNLKTKLLPCCGILIAIVMLAMTARAWLAPPAAVEQKLSAALPPQPVHPSKAIALAQTQTETLRVTITTTGFDPDELTHAPGQVTLAIDNRSGLEEVRLRLDREGGERLADVLVERGQLDWHDTVTLSAGRYLLTEANHPQWMCQITVE
jgi:hypothetical protein